MTTRMVASTPRMRRHRLQAVMMMAMALPRIAMLVKVRTSPVTMTKMGSATIWTMMMITMAVRTRSMMQALAPALIATAMVLRKTATFALEMMPPWTLIRMVPVTI